MRRLVLFSLAAVLVSLQLFHVELVAKEKAPVTKESVEKKVQELEQRLVDLKVSAKEFKEKGAATKAEVEAKRDELKALAKNGNLGDDAKRRIELFKTGEESKQLEAIDKAEDLGDEGVILLGAALKDSPHDKVRRQCLEAIGALGKSGLPAIAYAFQAMSDDDRIALVELLAKRDTTENLLLLSVIATKAEGEKVPAAAIKAGLASQQRLVFILTIAEALKGNDAVIQTLIDAASGFEGDDGLLLLYGAAHGAAPHAIAALKAAVQRKDEGLPVVVAAFKSKDPEVRTALVRTAKAIGGSVAQIAIDEALRAKSDELRQAAEKALSE